MVGEGGSLWGSVFPFLSQRPGRESWGYEGMNSNTPTRSMVTSGLSVPMATDGPVWGWGGLTAGLDQQGSFSSQAQGGKFWGSCVLWWILRGDRVGRKRKIELRTMTALMEPETSSTH